MNSIEKNPYAQLGVSSTKEGVHEATKDLSKGLYPGAFCKIVPIVGDLPQDVIDVYAQIIHSDGVGTKSNVAYIARQEGYGTEIYRSLPQDALVMNTDDMACVGVVDNIYISNHIARNANRVDDEDVATIIKGYTDFFNWAKSMGIHMYDAGGETADVGSYTTTLGIDVTATSIIEKDKIIDCSNIQPESIIVGLASDGKSSYENQYNSGIRSNGLTLGINSLLSRYYRRYKEVMDLTVENRWKFRFYKPSTWKFLFEPKKLLTGTYRLEDSLKDKLTGESFTIAEGILSPTRTYVPLLKLAFEEGVKISGIIHCSGGGMTKALNFGNGIRYVKDNLLSTPVIFDAIQEARRIEDKYMYQTFNMGTGMEIIVPNKEEADKIILIAQIFGIDAKIIGYTESTNHNTNEVIIKNDNKVFTYSK